MKDIYVTVSVELILTNICNARRARHIRFRIPDFSQQETVHRVGNIGEDIEGDEHEIWEGGKKKNRERAVKWNREKNKGHIISQSFVALHPGDKFLIGLLWISKVRLF